MISYGRQSISDDDIAAVVETLRGDWLTQGPIVERFEDAVAEYVGAKYAISFSNGTAALHGAVVAAGVETKDHVVTSPLTFMASANAARYVGARPELVDINPSTLNIDVERVPIDKPVIPVHFAGLPVRLDLLHQENRVVIEDAAHALGAQTPYGPVGNCANSDMTCFSFHPVKPITTAEGGMVTTNNDELAKRLKEFRSHGIVRRPEIDPWYYSINELGFNYRLTDLQSSLGISQLKKIDAFITRRNEIASRYRDLLKDSPVELPPEAPEGYLHGYHLFVIQVDDRRRIFDALRSAGIGVQVHYVPVHHHPISQDIELPLGGLPHCDRYYSRAISLPIYPDLTDDEQDFVVSTLHSNL